MLPCSGDVIARRKFLDHLDVGGQSGARENSLEQIVAQQRVVRNPAVHRGFENVDVVDSLSAERSFAEQILVHIGNRKRVRIDTAGAGENALEDRTVAPRRQRRRHSRLKHPVPLDHPAAIDVELRTVECVSHLADHPLGGSAR